MSFDKQYNWSKKGKKYKIRYLSAMMALYGDNLKALHGGSYDEKVKIDQTCCSYRGARTDKIGSVDGQK